MRRLLSLIAALVLAGAAAPPLAQAQIVIEGEGANGGSTRLVQGEVRGREAEDWTRLQAAQAAFAAGGYSLLRPHLPGLKAALGRTPRRYPAVEQRGSRTVVRADSEDDAMTVGLMRGVLAMMVGGRSTIESRPNVYPGIALLLASEAVEGGRHAEAIAILDPMLARQPQNRFLLAEKAAALNMLGRNAEVVALMDEALASGDILIAGNSSRLHRHRGYALIELGRLDEAEAAYREALEAEPGNATAEAQLNYIATLRAGGDKGEGGLTRPDAGPEAAPPKPED